MDEIRNLFHDSHFDIIGISETWLKPYVSNATVAVPGYKIHRNDRLKKRGGGVALYVRSDIKCFLVGISIDRGDQHSNRIDGFKEFGTIGVQFLFVEAHINQRVILVGVVYNPNPSLYDSREYLQPVFDQLLPRYSEILIVGDFNVDINKSCPRTCEFLGLLGEYGLSNFSNTPTHFLPENINYTPTCIDLLVTNRSNGILKFSQIDVPGFSRHDLIFFTYDVPMIPTANNPIFYRDYIKINYRAIQAYLDSHMDQFYYIVDINHQLNFLNSVIRDMFELYVPLKQSVNRSQNSWFTPDIELILHKRDEAYRIWKRTRTVASMNSYKYLRSQAKRSIYNSKQQFANNNFPDGLNTKELWKRIKSLGVGSKEQVPVPFNVNDINTGFTTHTNLTQTGTLSNSRRFDLFGRQVLPTEQFYFQNVSEMKLHSYIIGEIQCHWV